VHRTHFEQRADRSDRRTFIVSDRSQSTNAPHASSTGQPTTPSVSQIAAELKAVNAAERRGEPFVAGRDGAGAQFLVELVPDRWRLTVGRRDESDIPLPWDPEVSRAHALLERLADEWTVVDEGLSRNGTFVNGARVTGRQRLRNGDRVCVGATVLTFRDPGQDEAESTIRVRPASGSATLTPTQRQVLIALCRPLFSSAFATPATNRQIAAEVYLSVDAVKAHLRGLFERFSLADLPQNEKRARLAASVLADGILTPRDF
jgi:pSer/pThr/pTyr-binding forkhead associated (FHA) protein